MILKQSQMPERPVASEECLQWRLRGPVGVMALADALVREANSEEEKAFLVSELVLELARIQPREARSCLPAEEVQRGIRAVTAAFY